MYCHDCGHQDRFVLFVEFSVEIGHHGGGSEPGGTFGLQCPTCAGTDIGGVWRRLLSAVTA